MPQVESQTKENYLLASALMPELIPTTDTPSVSDAFKPALEQMCGSVQGASYLFAALDTIPAQKLELDEAKMALKISTLGLLFKFHNYLEVEAFLRGRPALSLALFTINQSLKKYFAGPFSLELLPADEDSTDPQLVLWVHTNLAADQARSIIKAYRSEWWRKNMRPEFKNITVSCSF